MSKKVIALIAHDGKKDEMVEWALKNKERLADYELCGTGNTSRRVAEATGLAVQSFPFRASGGRPADRRKGRRRADRQHRLFLGSFNGSAARSGCARPFAHRRRLQHSHRDERRHSGLSDPAAVTMHAAAEADVGILYFFGAKNYRKDFLNL